MSIKNLFTKLDGTPAQILIVLGLALTLFVPVWRRFEEAGISKAKARLDQAQQIFELGMAKLMKDLGAERKKIDENTTLPFEERTKKVEELRKGAESKLKDLEEANDTTPWKRALLVAQANVAGARWHYAMEWLGKLMLLLGLLTITIQSEGLKQKILLIVLLAVMLGSLASINPGLKNIYPEQSFEGTGRIASMVRGQSQTSKEISIVHDLLRDEIAEILRNPPPPPPEPVPGVVGGVIGGIVGGIPGGIPGGVPGGGFPMAPTPRRIEPLQPVQQIRVGGSVQQANLIRKTTPIYPPLAKAARVQGAVILEATLSKQGTVMNLRVLSGHPLLVQAAMDAVKQWRYRPTLLNGAPVEVITTITVNFALAGD